MPEKTADPKAAHQTEIAISRLDSLETLPCVATQFFSKLTQFQSPSVLAEIIESDPALSAKIFALMHQHGIGAVSIRQGIGKLPAHVVRDMIFSVKISGDPPEAGDEIPSLKRLVEHALAVACCAEDIAESLSPKADSQLAYSAGLLHDIGKLALRQVMPKSFARILEEAKSQQACSCTIEQKYLGIDHTIAGKRLAQKWRLPNEIMLAIWLHHNEASTISQDIPQAKIAQIVHLADQLARQCGIGQSGSYDSANSSGQTAKAFGISPSQLEQIRRNLGEKVGQKSKILGLDLPQPIANYCDVIGATAAKLTQKNTELSLENSRLQTAAGNFDFIADLLLSLNSAVSPIETAENFAVRWQKFYQTGKVCAYLAPPSGEQMLEAVVVENLLKSSLVYLNVPEDSQPIPAVFQKGFAILDAHEHIDWLFEQLEADFDSNYTKIVPLISGSKVIGAIAFELRYPGDAELYEETFKMTTSVAAVLLEMASAGKGQQQFAERFARLFTQVKAVQQPPPAAYPINVLAEMAGGAAHELNNPLSVISGRSQLLAKAETDPEKKRMLKQIQDNAGEIAQIIEDMMVFAKPPEPRRTETNIEQMLDEAIHLAAKKQNAEELDIQVAIAETCKSVFVDSAQIASAIANILCNSLESYTDKHRPIKVTIDAEEPANSVRVQITDFGCGMDSQTLQKATQPFFSEKPAGRKRGMGLAHAQRLIQINEGSFYITSQLGSGTTVTILLPCKQRKADSK